MEKGIDQLLKQNKKLIREKKELTRKLTDANAIIEGIKKGAIDAVMITGEQSPRVLVSESADQAYRRFIENMSEGVVTLHTDGTIIYSNSSFAGMVNSPLQKVIGTNFRHFIPAEYAEAFEGYFNDHPKNDVKVELSILNHKGRRKHFIVSLNTLPLQDFVALNLVCTDVTDQKKAEAKLLFINENLKRAVAELTLSEEKVVFLNGSLKENIKTLKDANIELATFAHIASHDLQEPLRKIMTYCSIIKTDYFDVVDPRGQDYINKMQGASARMRNLINDILAYSELSREEIVFGPINVQTMVTEIVSDLEMVINETKAKISIAKDLPVIEGNSIQMRQLFQNIISNALKFIRADSIPQISISGELRKGSEVNKVDEGMGTEKFYNFYIQDNGIGFAPEYVDKIFTIFQKLNNNAAYKGTGIGLAICKRIVDNHKGFITAESKRGEGALFTISLPVCQPIRQKRGYAVGSMN